METKGRHILCDIWLNEPLTDEVMKKFTTVIDENLTVMHRAQYKFEPVGLTLAYILAESHFTVHTYPEHQYLSLDIYICADHINLEGLIQKMLKNIKVKKLNQQIIERGIESP